MLFYVYLPRLSTGRGPLDLSCLERASALKHLAKQTRLPKPSVPVLGERGMVGLYAVWRSMDPKRTKFLNPVRKGTISAQLSSQGLARAASWANRPCSALIS